MSLIVVEHVSLSFGAQRVLVDANFRIGEGERIGLIGPNGAGKSTLLKLMLGEQGGDDGKVRHARNLRIGYLSQDIQEIGRGTLLESVLRSVPGRMALEDRLDSLDADMAATEDPGEQLHLATAIAELAEKLEHFERYYSERRARQILLGLGFGDSEVHRNVEELSGGWKMRAALCGLLFQQPDVLFLDEPTNHLDLQSVLWLGRFLRDLPCAIVLICHDRDFLNAQVDRVLSFEPEGLRAYTGNYDAYLEQREIEETIQGRSRENRERELERAKKFVERFRSKATKARQAQSRARRVKRLNKELEESRPIARRKALSFSFPEVARTGRDVVRIEGLHKAFGPLQLYRGVEKAVHSGDRIAIVGRNGAGKTTLLRMLAGDLAPDAGAITMGAGVNPGYYAQHMSDLLNPRRTVLDEVRASAPGASESQVRAICGAFLFSGDDMDKVVGVLSGGERARVQLARLLANPGNLLLMDEPTNHLDIAAADALAEALDGFGGTLIVVSHNTAFVTRLATRIWDVVDGDIVDFPGRLDEYLAQLERRAAAQKSASQKLKSPRTKAPKTGPKKKVQRPGKRSNASGSVSTPTQVAAVASAPAAPAASRRPRHRRRRIRSDDAELATRITALQVERNDLEAELALPDMYGTPDFDVLYRRFVDVDHKLDELRGRREPESAPPPASPPSPPASAPSPPAQSPAVSTAPDPPPPEAEPGTIQLTRTVRRRRR